MDYIKPLLRRRPLLFCLALLALLAPGALTWRVTLAAVSSAINPAAVHAGDGTYYDATGAGNCSFPASPENLMVAAMNNADYGSGPSAAQYCGAYIRVTGPKGSVLVRVVDKCPECLAGDVDMSREAFAKIADLVAGRVDITWRLVSPSTLSGPIIYHFKDGSNPWWTAVQIRNHRNPIKSVEYLSGGVYKPLVRQDYNYFLDSSGMGAGPYTLRVTDIFGNVIVDSGIPLMDNGSKASTKQFPVAYPAGTPTVGSATVTRTATSAPLPNLLKNGGFELDANGDGKPDSWTVHPSVSRSRAARHGGTFSMRHSSSANASYVVGQLSGGIAPLELYELAAWTNIPPTGDSFGYRLELVWLDAARSIIRTDVVKLYSAATAGWVRAGGTYQAPAEAASVLVRMRVSGLAATIYSDDVKLLRRGLPTPTSAPSPTP